MKSKNRIEILLGFLGLLIIIAVFSSMIFGSIWLIGAVDCWADFSDSKFEYRYKVFKGCQYQSEEGWLPERRLRNLN